MRPSEVWALLAELAQQADAPPPAG